MFNPFSQPKPAGAKPKEEPKIKIELLKDVKELSAEQQAGLITVSINDLISEYLENEVFYRRLRMAESESHGKSRDEIDNNRSGAEKMKKWLEDKKKELQILRDLREEIKKGEYKL